MELISLDGLADFCSQFDGCGDVDSVSHFGNEDGQSHCQHGLSDTQRAEKHHVAFVSKEPSSSQFIDQSSVDSWLSCEIETARRLMYSGGML